MPTLLPTSVPMSPTQVAQATGTSRRTVMRAIESQELKAFRDNRNHWKITPQAIEEWANAHCAPTGQRPPDAQVLAYSVQVPAQDETTLELAAARATIAQLEARLEDRAALVRAAEDRAQAAELERDRWRNMAERLVEPSGPPDPPSRRRRWWLF